MKTSFNGAIIDARKENIGREKKRNSLYQKVGRSDKLQEGEKRTKIINKNSKMNTPHIVVGSPFRLSFVELPS